MTNAEIKDCIESTIRETNRIMHRWKTGNPDLLNQQDIQGLFFTWFSKKIKSKIGWREFNHIIKNGKPYIEMQGNNISKIRLGYNEYNNPIYPIVQQIDYSSLIYNEVVENLKEISQVSFNNLKQISF